MMDDDMSDGPPTEDSGDDGYFDSCDSMVSKDYYCSSGLDRHEKELDAEHLAWEEEWEMEQKRIDKQMKKAWEDEKNITNRKRRVETARVAAVLALELEAEKKVMTKLATDNVVAIQKAISEITI